MTGQAEFWDERYRGEGFSFGTEPNAFLASQAHHLKPGLRALVPGDGEGRNGVWLAQQGLAVDTADVSPIGVAKARELQRRAASKSTLKSQTFSTGTGRAAVTTSSRPSTFTSSTLTGRACIARWWTR